MKKVLLFFLALAIVASVSAQSSQTQEPELSECNVLEASDAELIDGATLQQDDVLGPEDEVSVSEDGSVVLVCNDGFREVQPGEEGMVSDVAVRTDEFDTDVPETDQDLEEALQETEQIEQNLEDVNQMIDETVPDRVASIILGDNVNLQVDDTTIGIETNSSGVTGVEENGFENPDLEISMDSQSIERIMTSENTAEEFREEFHGDGINVEAYTWRNRISLGVVTTTSRVYGFVSNFR